MAKADILLVLTISGEQAPFTTGASAGKPEEHTSLVLPAAFASMAQVESRGVDLADPTEASALVLAKQRVSAAFPKAYSIESESTTPGHVWRDGMWQPIHAADEFGFAFRVTQRIPGTTNYKPYHGTLADGNAGYDLHVVVQNA